MAGKSTALTEQAIQRLSKPADGGRREKFDRLAPGLCLRVSASGRKSWIGHYRLDGRLQKIGLGEWPAVKVDEAREAMRRVRAQAKAGIDPKQAREAEHEAARQTAREEAEKLRTFHTVAEEYIKRECPKLKNGKDIESYIRRHLIPAWGDRPISNLRKRDAIRLLDPLIDANKTPTALKLHEVIRRIFNWAADRDEIDVSPFANLKPPARKEPRQRVLSHAEIKLLWRVCDNEGFPWGPMLKFLLLTGARRGEVAAMCWRELDDPSNPSVWTVPADRSKNRLKHRLPLSQPARDILAALPCFTHGDYVFTTTDGRRPVSGFSKTATRIRNALVTAANKEGIQFEVEFRWHDLRRTVRTELARLRVSEIVAERILNHSGDALVRTYNVHQYDAEKAEALDRWAGELMSIVETPENTREAAGKDHSPAQE